MLKSIQKCIELLPEKIYLFKIKYSEELAIRKKRSLYSDTEWSDEQRKSFDEFWIENYGKKIKPWWNKLYESMNGVYCKEYFPEMLYSTKLEPALNPEHYCDVLNDKNLLSTVYGSVENVFFPKTYVSCCNGVFCDGKHNILTKEDAVKTVSDVGICVAKPTVDSGSGHGVHILNIKNGEDIKSGKKISDIFDEYNGNFTVQERITNSEKISAVYPDSLNTFRVITYIVEDGIHCAPVTMRIGVGKEEIDNIHNGGLCVGVDWDGKLKSKAYQLGYGDKATTFKAHPDTGTVFEDYCVGNIGRIVETAKKLHAVTPQLGIISWDFTVDKDERIILIEANCSGQSVWFPQIVNEKPVFGDDTVYMIKKMRNK